MKLYNLLLGAVFVVHTLAASAQEAPTNGLVAHYTFTGDLHDGTQNGHDGSLNGTGISFGIDRFNNANSALHLAGGGYVSVVPTPFDVNSDYTISFWTKLDNTGNSVDNFLSTGWDNNDALNIRIVPNTSVAWEFIPKGVDGVVSLPPTNYYDWHSMVCVRQGSNDLLYMDGALTASGSHSGLTTDSGSLWIGRHQDGSSFFYDLEGSIDDIRIYNRALSVDEITNLYAVEVPIVPPHTAIATAVSANGFIVGINLTDPGFGYTNTPLVRIIGGGGAGAQALATVSNGLVVSVNIMNAGLGYTTVPFVVIEPPFIPQPALKLAALSLLTFSNLTMGGSYQLQISHGWYWSNVQEGFVASDTSTQIVPAGQIGLYRLALAPVPQQAFATPQVVNGFLVGANISSGGSGYSNSPALNIVGGGGSNATAIVQITNGVVVNIQILNAGSGYTGSPILEIAPPPATALAPVIQPGLRIDASPLAPYDNYQLQFNSGLNQPWQDWAGVLSPTDITNSQIFPITNNAGFFRLKYLP